MVGEAREFDKDISAESKLISSASWCLLGSRRIPVKFAYSHKKGSLPVLHAQVLLVKNGKKKLPWSQFSASGRFQARRGLRSRFVLPVSPRVTPLQGEWAADESKDKRKIAGVRGRNGEEEDQIQQK